ncbi:hypothetical protein LFYK43_17020 [Ligilactobacillus salitolerans]|uniref:CBM6 domain-containing protein n=1 Tax=Ligilactobacillus salitolerans TaxID=1808352 RepID=A0A401IUK8_9LACO|nr:carbohydrate-binding protein [Ligilactobacillus salitolerans]GBG95243.1 hypothetical protein LFYK43_17020 [Ligilactobacillus salitolerans]
MQTKTKFRLLTTFSLGAALALGVSANAASPGRTDKLLHVDPTNATTFEAENAIDQTNVTIESKAPASAGKNVGGIYNSSQVGYPLKVQKNGKYQVTIRWAVGKGGTTKDIADVTVDGTKVDSLTGTYTGGWGDKADQWQDITTEVDLTKGVHSLGIQATTSGFNLDKISVQRVGNYTPSTVTKKSHAPIVRFHGVRSTMTSTELAQSQIWYNQDTRLENKISPQASLNLTRTDQTDVPTIYIDPANKGQVFLGMGTSIEGSSIANLTKMSAFQRRRILRNLVDPINGAGMTMFRICIGTSDFTGDDFYTYYDEKPAGYANKDGYDTKTPAKDIHPDWYNRTGHGFSIKKDEQNGTIDVIQELLQEARVVGVKNQIKLFASSWSAPGWMKEPTANTASASYQPNNLLIKGGKLRDDMVDNLARYEVRFLEEYAKKGIKIYGLTVQNEPQNETVYPSMLINAEQNGKVALKIRQYAAQSPILRRMGISQPKIWAFDHNFSKGEAYMDEMFAKVPEARKAISGTAFHDYDGEPTAMKTVLQKYQNQIPGFSVNLTERSVWGTKGADRILKYFRNGAESYNSWVTMLDSNTSPTKFPWKVDPTLLIKDPASQNYWSTPEYYIMGQFGRYIRPGMRLISSTYGSENTITNAVFYDQFRHDYVMVAVNQTLETQQFKAQYHGKQFLATIPAKNVATYRWHE